MSTAGRTPCGSETTIDIINTAEPNPESSQPASKSKAIWSWSSHVIVPSYISQTMQPTLGLTLSTLHPRTLG